MPSRVRPSSIVGASMRHGGAVLAALGVWSAWGAPTAGATTAITPGVTPLTMLTPQLPSRCPGPATLNGTALAASIGRAAKSGSANRAFNAVVRSFTPQAAIALCDPAAAAQRRLIGPITGTTSLNRPTDQAFFGQRALVPWSHDTARALLPGDRLAFPAVSPATLLDVSVETTTGTRTVRVPGAASSPTAVSIQGTRSAPSVVVTRADGTTTTLPIARPPLQPLRLHATVHGSTLVLAGGAAPGTALLVMADQGRSRLRQPLTSGFTGPGGRFSGVALAGLVHADHVAKVLAINPITRSREAALCTLAWSSAARLRGTRCATTHLKSLGTTFAAVPHRATALAAAVDPAAADATVAIHATRSVGPVGPAGAKPAKLATTPGTTTVIAPGSMSDGFKLARADVNGDGRPDGIGQQYDRRPIPLAVSEGAGWKQVQLKGAGDFGVGVYPGLGSDGRGDLAVGSITGGFTLVSDALATPTLPATLDFSTRVASPNDIRVSGGPLFLGGDFSGPAGLTASDGPQGTVPDVTGDGRPELVLNAEGPLVYASQDFVAGHSVTLATLAPLGEARSLASYALLSGADTVTDAVGVDRRDLTSVIVGRSLYTAQPADDNRRSATLRPITVAAINGAGRTLSARSFKATGVPKLVDVDPATGDALVFLWHAGRCGHASCVDRLVRVAPSGWIRAEVSIPRINDEVPNAAFTPDGPDADTAADVALWASSNGFGIPPFPAQRPTSQGTIAILASTTTGAVPLDRLPVLAEHGHLLQYTGDLSSAVLADGSHWLGGPFPTEQAYATRRPLVDNALVSQAP